MPQKLRSWPNRRKKNSGSSLDVTHRKRRGVLFLLTDDFSTYATERNSPGSTRAFDNLIQVSAKQSKPLQRND